MCGERFRVLASPSLGDPLLVSKDRKLGLVSVHAAWPFVECLLTPELLQYDKTNFVDKE